MKTDSDKAASYKFLPTVASMVVIVTGCLVLTGWLFNLPILQHVLPGLPKMTGNTAVAFVLAGFSLLFYSTLPGPAADHQRRLAQPLAAVVTLIALLTLSEYLFGWDIGLDQLLFRDPAGALETSIPGRPSPHTALAFALAGLSLLLLHGNSPRRHWLAQYLILTAAFVALLALVGYGFSISSLFRISAYTGMALHTAVAFIVLCAGLLFLHPDRGFMALMTAANLGGVMARRLILVAIGIPLLVAWVSIWGKRAELYDTEFEPVLLAVLIAYVYSGAIWWYAHSLNRMDADRKQAEEQFRLVVETSPNAIILVNTEGEISLVNERTQVLFGYEREELLGQPIEMLVPPSSHALHRRQRDAFFSEPAARPMGAGRDLFGLRKDGSQVPVEIGLNPITTSEGSFVLASILDITERKRAEAALTENEQRFRALIEHAPDGIVIFGSSGRIEYASPATGRILGYSPDEMVNADPAQITHPDDLPGLLLTLSELLQTPGKIATAQYRMQHKDGSWRWLESNVSNFSDVPGIEGLVFNFRDVTKRKQAEEALRQSEARYRAIVEDQTELIKRSRADGTILFVNQAYCRTFGTTPEEIVGQNFLSLLGETERKIVQEKISRLTPDNPVEINEYQDVLPDGRVVCLRWTDRGIFDDSGRLLEVQGVGYDVTERREAEEKLRQSETQLQYVIDTVPEGVLLLAADGSIRLTNPILTNS